MAVRSLGRSPRGDRRERWCPCLIPPGLVFALLAKPVTSRRTFDSAAGAEADEARDFPWSVFLGAHDVAIHMMLISIPHQSTTTTRPAAGLFSNLSHASFISSPPVSPPKR